MKPIDLVLSKLENPKHANGSYKALCPAHPDRNPSLSITENADGNVGIHCFAGCATADVVHALGIGMTDLFSDDDQRSEPIRSRIIKTYDYRDADGNLVFQTVRKEPKAFMQRRPDGRGDWLYNLRGIERVLYRLPEVLAAVDEGRTVWIVEGEKDADALVAAGEVATCSPQGADNWDKVPTARDVLAGAEVVVWVDNDPQGHRYGRSVIADVGDFVGQWKVVHSPYGKDAAEHLGQRRNLDADLKELARSNGDREWLDTASSDPDTEIEDEPPPPALRFENIGEVASRVDSAPPPRFIARPVWVEDAYGVIGAEDKAGKSWAALDLAVAVASGGRWLDQFECEVPGPVCMFLGEGSDRKTVRRMRAVCEFHRVKLEDLAIRVTHRAPNLTRSDHLDAIRFELEENPPRLVVLDPLYLSLGSTNSSQLSEMGNVLGALQHRCQAVNAALVVVHHWNQSGTGTDRKRFSGAGLAEWGRVLASVAVTNKSTDDNGASVVDQSWEFIGDEIADLKVPMTRRVWADNGDDMTSAMHYAVVRPLGGPAIAEDVYDRDADVTEAILDALSGGVELSGTKLCSAVRDAGVKVRDQDVRRVAQNLAGASTHDGDVVLRMRLGQRNAQLFRLAKEVAK